MKSSIHIIPVKSGSESHNNRLKELDYVRSDLSHLNSSFISKSIDDTRKTAEKICKEKTGRTMQEKATPVREGVLLISKSHTADDLIKLGNVLEKRFGIKTIQAYCHKDEGHYDKKTKEWKPNYHGHMVFDWTNHQTGKSIKLDKKDLSDLQTIVAKELNLERGKTSDLRHLNAIEYKNLKEKESLLETEKTLEKLTKIKTNRNLEVRGTFGIDKKATIENYKGAFEEQLLANNYLSGKIDSAKREIEIKEQEVERLKESLIYSNQVIKKQKVELNDICLSVLLGNDKKAKEKGNEFKDIVFEKLEKDLDKTIYLQEAWKQKISLETTLNKLVKETDWKFSTNSENKITGLIHPDSTIKINLDSVENVFNERVNLREEKHFDKGQNRGGLELN